MNMNSADRSIADEPLIGRMDRSPAALHGRSAAARVEKFYSDDLASPSLLTGA